MLLGPSYQVVEFNHPTQSAVDTANAIGSGEYQISKSFIFCQVDNHLVFIIVCGDKRKAEEIIGKVIFGTDANLVKLHSEFSIDGIPHIVRPVHPTVNLD